MSAERQTTRTDYATDVNRCKRYAFRLNNVFNAGRCANAVLSRDLEPSTIIDAKSFKCRYKFFSSVPWVPCALVQEKQKDGCEKNRPVRKRRSVRRAPRSVLQRHRNVIRKIATQPIVAVAFDTVHVVEKCLLRSSQESQKTHQSKRWKRFCRSTKL